MLSGMTESMRAAQGWVPDDSTFGARLALVRQRMQWTNVKEAAEACAIAVESWRRWEAGKTEPRSLVSACLKIAGVTGVDYRWLALGPDTSLAASADQTVGTTLRYSGLGERVVAITQTDRRLTLPRTTRTRPINLGQTVSRAA